MHTSVLQKLMSAFGASEHHFEISKQCQQASWLTVFC